jgi:hypothetical protein
MTYFLFAGKKAVVAFHPSEQVRSPGTPVCDDVLLIDEADEWGTRLRLVGGEYGEEGSWSMGRLAPSGFFASL